MKILFITPYITNNCHPAFLKRQTGFGYMVNEIAEYVGRKEEVDVFSFVLMSPSIKAPFFNIIGHDYFSIARYFNIGSIIKANRFLKRYKSTSLKNTFKTYAKFCILSQVEKIIKEYDIVHIHGITDATYATIDICLRNNVKFLVTLHGLISFEDDVIAGEGIKQYEKDFLIEAYKNKYHVSFVSSGIKSVAINYIKNQIDIDETDI